MINRLLVKLVSIAAALMLGFLSSPLFAKQQLQLSYKVNKSAVSISNDMELKTVGKAEFSYLFWDIYDSILYTQSGIVTQPSIWFEQAPLMLEIRYKRDIKAKDLVDSTIEQWQHLKIPATRYEAYPDWLLSIWPNLKDGDRLALLMYPDHSTFFYNGEFLAHQQDPDFAQLFLSIWLDKNTSEPKLRAKLLNLK